jgi:hypothetical protein
MSGAPAFAWAEMTFFSAGRRDRDEPMSVHLVLPGGPEHTRAALALGLGYIATVAHDLARIDGLDPLWAALATGVGPRPPPSFLTIVRQRPAEPTRVYRAELRSLGGTYDVVAPRMGLGDDAYYLSLAVSGLLLSLAERLGQEAVLLDRGVRRLLAAKDARIFDPIRMSDPGHGSAVVQTQVAELLEDRAALLERGRPASRDEPSDPAARAALRDRCREALREAGAVVAAAGDDLLIGHGTMRLHVATPTAVVICAHLIEPAIDPDEDLESLNGAPGVAPWLARYRSAAGTTELGMFVRLAIPDPPPPVAELARWLGPQVFDLALARAEHLDHGA